MPDLKAAAEIMRVALKEARSGQVILAVKNDLDMAAQMDAVCDSLLLAAQALETWAWQQERGAKTRRNPMDSDGRTWNWACDTFGDEPSTYYADTPLGAILAAMEGEGKDGN